MELIRSNLSYRYADLMYGLCLMNQNYRIVLVRATEVLGSRTDAEGWLESPKKALGQHSPVEIINTEEGLQKVLALLGNIEHGVFS